jgi:iron complex outermembrane recepter protein
MMYRILLGLFLLCISIPMYAQPKTTEQKDSLKVYRLGEIVVGAEQDREVKTTTVQQIGFARLQRSDVPTAERLADQIPAAKIRTNSRGEALIFLRGTGERQVAVFLDGALLNIPWDNRIDLSLLPLNAIGSITIAKGVPSVLYGANVIGGAVNFVSQERNEAGVLSDLVLQGGQNGFLSGAYTNMGAFGAFNYVATLGYTRRSGYTVPADAELPFYQAADALRTNTDQRLANGYLRGEYRISDRSTLGLSLNYIEGEKGIAPEGHTDDVRFWRYPDWRYFNVTLNTDHFFTESKDLSLRGAVWVNSFAQSIHQYDDSTYTTLDAREDDKDRTIGTRLVLRKDFEASALNLAINALTSTHDQKDFSYTNGIVTDPNVPSQLYEQQLYSIGLEYEATFAERLDAVLGATWDGMSTPRTGDKPSQGTFSDYSAMLGLSYDLGSSLAARASVGRKTRFPTMRELYGEALRRFVLNPDLRAEESTIGEAGLSGDMDWGTFDVVGFNYWTDRTIERIDTVINGTTFRKRVNLAGSTTPGIEISALLTHFRPFTAEASFTWMQPRAVNANADGSFYLSERPEILATLALDYYFPWGLQPTLELSHTGVAYSPFENTFVELPPYTLLNVRLAYRFFFESISGQVFARVNNLTDATPLNQLGLPGSGREIQGGIKLSF